MRLLKYLNIVFFISSFLFAQPEIPRLNRYANDFTNTLSSSQLEYLNDNLLKFNERTSTQIVFLMIKTLGGYPLERFSYEVAEKNKIGTKGNDNGILFLVVKDDKKMRIEVGYGLEGALPDALASSIIRNEVAPYFKAGEYFKGIITGLNAIIQAVKGEYTGKKNKKKKKEKGNLVFWINLIIFALFWIFSAFRRRGGGFIYLGGFGGGFGGGSSGGFGGGGFGGFSGGGGSFGGGGASGGW